MMRPPAPGVGAGGLLVLGRMLLGRQLGEGRSDCRLDRRPQKLTSAICGAKCEIGVSRLASFDKIIQFVKAYYKFIHRKSSIN